MRWHDNLWNHTCLVLLWLAKKGGTFDDTIPAVHHQGGRIGPDALRRGRSRPVDVRPGSGCGGPLECRHDGWIDWAIPLYRTDSGNRCGIVCLGVVLACPVANFPQTMDSLVGIDSQE